MLYWFNPENDLALAAGSANYTPPKAAVALRRAGAKLPTLWTADQDKVLTVDECDDDASILCGRAQSEADFAPWGWSAYAAGVFKRHGADPGALPDDEDLALMRRLSHRATASRVLELIGYPAGLIPVVASSVGEVGQAVNKWGRAIVKLPWSCSGRGILPVSVASLPAVSGTLQGMIARQGSVTVEPLYDRVRDFAALFHRSEGMTRFRGISIFSSDPSGHYAGNMIAPQAQLMAELGIDLSKHISKLTAALDGAIRGYDGWVGVDMLSYREPDGTIGIAPCIEVNLRMTMGVAALLAAEAGKLPWKSALLRVRLPGEKVPEKAITLSAVTPVRNEPITSPVMTVEPSELT